MKEIPTMNFVMIEMRRSDQENPERAYRRGFQQGVQAVVAALEGKIDPTIWGSLQDYVDGKVAQWRYSKRGR